MVYHEIKNLTLKNLKKNLSVLIILVYIVNITGFTLVYFHLKVQVKDEVFNKIRSEKFDKVEIITISKRSLEKNSVSFRMLEKHEFLYEGKMYDIISKTEDNENIIFYCVHDEKEEELDLAFQKHFENTFEDNSTKKISTYPNKKMVDIGFISLITIRIKAHFQYNAQNGCFNNYNNFVSEIDFPPPQFI